MGDYHKDHKMKPLYSKDAEVNLFPVKYVLNIKEL